MKGILRALSIQSYGLYDKSQLLRSFTIKDVLVRRKLDVLQGREVDFDKQIMPLLKK